MDRKETCKGLPKWTHPKFENRRVALYGSGKLPTLEQAISAIISEETRLKLEAASFVTQGIMHQ